MYIIALVNAKRRRWAVLYDQDTTSTDMATRNGYGNQNFNEFLIVL